LVGSVDIQVEGGFEKAACGKTQVVTVVHSLLRAHSQRGGEGKKIRQACLSLRDQANRSRNVSETLKEVDEEKERCAKAERRRGIGTSGDSLM